MTTLGANLLASVAGGQNNSDYPNESTVRMANVDPCHSDTRDWTCWDSKWDADYRFCVPSSQANSPGGRGNPWYLPKSYIAEREKEAR